MAWSSQTGDLLFDVMEAASDNSLYHVESVTTGTTTWTHNGSTRDIVVLAMALGYIQTILLDSVGGENKSLPLPQIPDVTYSNP